LSAGTYVVRAHAANAIGAPRIIRIGRGASRIRLVLTVPKLDRARKASARFVPGQPFSLSVKDAKGITYLLELPPNALPAARTISMTAYRSVSLPGRPVGTAIELAPSGLRLSVPGSLTVRGGGAVRGVLLTADYSRGQFLPVTSTVDRGERTFNIEHFSLWGDVDNTTTSLDALLLDYLSGASAADILADITALGEAAQALGTDIDGLLGRLPSGMRKQLETALRGYRKELAREATALSGAACASGPDKASLQRALDAIATAKAMGAIDPAEAVSLKSDASLVCVAAFLKAGGDYCRTAEKNQDAAGRLRGRQEYLRFAYDLAVSVQSPYAQTVKVVFNACTGYSAHIETQTTGGHAFWDVHTCMDVIASGWKGLFTFQIASGENVYPVDFTVAGSGQEFTWHASDDNGHVRYRYVGHADIPTTLTLEGKVDNYNVDEDGPGYPFQGSDSINAGTYKQECPPGSVPGGGLP
jgi:hypothetical protein